MKESIESAQYINFKNHHHPRINIDDQLKAHLEDQIQEFKQPHLGPDEAKALMRESHQSNVTHLRVESMLDSASVDMKTISNSPVVPHGQELLLRFKANYSQLNSNNGMMTIGNPTPPNFMQTPNNELISIHANSSSEIHHQQVMVG